LKEDRRVGVFVGRSAYIRDPDNNVIELIDLVRANRRVCAELNRMRGG
jgi:hypothetical protein